MNRDTALVRQECSYFKQISTLGLPFCVVLPEIFESLRRLVGFSQGVFVDLGTDLFPTYYFGDWDVPSQTPIGDILYEEFLNTERLAKVSRSRAELLALPPISRLDNLLLLSPDEYRLHEIYQRVAGPAQVHYTLYVKLTDPRSGHVRLMLMNRPHGKPDFNPEDVRRLSELLPLLFLAMNGNQGDEQTWVESRDQAILVLDTQGRVQYLGGDVSKILQHALDRRQAPVRRWKPFKPEAIASEILRNLLRRLPCAGVNCLETPSLQWCNRWGRFQFRARWLEPIERDMKPFIMVTVIRHIPLPLKLATVLRTFSLSAREYSVCLEIALGSSFKDIARKLGLSPSTVVTHSQAIYEKLGITGRSELLTSLYTH